jgi:uncharacterized repeat protein (TIGR03803 family)
VFAVFRAEALERRLFLSATPATLYSLSAADGGPASGITVDSGGNLYGTTQGGGAYGNGEVWELAKGSSTLTTLYSFTGGADGYTPLGITIDSSGNLYGTASQGGAGYADAGTVWELAKGSSTLTTLYTFTGGADGEDPQGITIDSGGNLYGTTDEAGTDREGNVWELAKGSSAVVTLYAFTESSEDEVSIAVDGSGNLFGGNEGSVWELVKGSATLTTLSSTVDAGAGITIDSSGNLYGTTWSGGSDNDGTVWELAKGSSVVVTVYSFTGGPDGEVAEAIKIDSSGNLYGTTEEGGAHGQGTVFEFDPSIKLYSFNGAVDPLVGIAVDGNGNLYGTADAGGSDNDGSVWELAKGSSTASTLYSFSSAVAPGEITIDSAGNLYGTTNYGGAGFGSVWELAQGSSTITTLYSFTDWGDGGDPLGGITVDSSGNLYGTTGNGGANTDGTIWELAKGSSTVTILYSFGGNGFGGGVGPTGIIVDSSGNLYGTNQGGGDSTNCPTIWELAKGSSTPTTLYTNSDISLTYPYAITVDSSGNLYGTSSYESGGSAWEFAKGSNAPTSLYAFTGGTDGGDPAGITIDSSGNLYGIISSVSGNGAIFAFAGVGASSSLTLTTPAASTSVNEGSSYTIDWTGGNSTDTVQLWAEGGPDNSWTELTTGVPETNGSYTWNTTGVAHGWYYFQAWDIPASGTPYAVQSPDWLHVVAPSASAPNISLTNPPLAGDSVAQGNTYTLDFTASDGSGDTNPIFVQLWVYSGNTGQWTELPNANYLPATQGSYAWDTTGVAPGWYAFAAHVTDGDQWSYASSPGWLNITVPTPTIAFTTPTSGQSVAAGGTFNLNWNITGLSSADASTATVQIWAQHLVNGSAVWSEIAASVSASGGTYAWTVPTSPGAGTYYAFSIWLNDGDMWWAQASPNWLQVT